LWLGRLSDSLTEFRQSSLVPFIARGKPRELLTSKIDQLAIEILANYGCDHRIESALGKYLFYSISSFFN
jgi:hypothetical protein